MGGIDKMHFLVSLYRINIKSRKWTLRMIFHFVDVCVINSWLAYQRHCNSKSVAEKERLNFLSFRSDLAEALKKVTCCKNLEQKKAWSSML